MFANYHSLAKFGVAWHGWAWYGSARRGEAEMYREFKELGWL